MHLLLPSTLPTGYLLTVPCGPTAHGAPQVYYARYTQAADVFSFSILLWEVAHVERPFRSLSSVDVAVEVTLLRRRPPLTPAPHPDGGFRAGLHALMSECWQQDAASRPNMATVAARLQGLADATVEAQALGALSGEASASASGVELSHASSSSGSSKPQSSHWTSKLGESLPFRSILPIRAGESHC